MEITGRLTVDAKVSTLKDERQIVNFTIAVNDYYKPTGSNESKNIATYVQCAYWRNSNIAKHLTKGALVELSGRVGVNAYIHMDGTARASLTFHVNSIKIHSKGKSQSIENTSSIEVSSITEPLEDLPF